MKALILAGGTGTRLWPLSQSETPKQFIHFFHDTSLLQNTLKRCLKSFLPEDIYILTHEKYAKQTKKHIQGLIPDPEKHIILEPCSKNTAPAVAMGIRRILELKQANLKETFFVCPSDHLILEENLFENFLLQAKKLAEKPYLVTFGIQPQNPHTGYGYIKKSKPFVSTDAYYVDRFVEKPDLKTAQDYLESGQYLWNSGMFFFSAATFFNNLKQHCPSIWKLSQNYTSCLKNFSQMPCLSLDYAIMEKSASILTLPIYVNWSDVGCWDSIYQCMEKDADANVSSEGVITIQSKNNLILSREKPIATIGVDDLLIIDTKQGLLISKKGESQRVKDVLEILKKQAKPPTSKNKEPCLQ